MKDQRMWRSESEPLKTCFCAFMGLMLHGPYCRFRVKDRQTYRQTDRHTYRHTHTHTHSDDGPAPDQTEAGEFRECFSHTRDLMMTMSLHKVVPSNSPMGSCTLIAWCLFYQIVSGQSLPPCYFMLPERRCFSLLAPPLCHPNASQG